jgi:hypothetical protein
MKAKCLLPLVMALFAFTLPSWADSAAAVNTSVDNSIAPDDQSTASQPTSADAFPGTVSGTISMPSLDLRHVDVGIDFLVQETAVGPNTVYGVGMMFTFKSP